jgi:hypothetical protein
MHKSPLLCRLKPETPNRSLSRGAACGGLKLTFVMTKSVVPSGQHNELEDRAEKQAERVATAMMCTVSFVQMAQSQGATPFLEVLDRKGRTSQIPASSICNKRLVEKFLDEKGLAGLCSLSLIGEQALEKAYGEWLRARKRSKYALIDEPSDIEWLERICGLALIERVVWNKRDQNVFVDVNAAMKAETAFQIRQDRSFICQAVQHAVKHQLSPEEAAEYINTIYEKHIRTIEEHQGHILPRLSEPKETDNE